MTGGEHSMRRLESAPHQMTLLSERSCAAAETNAVRKASYHLLSQVCSDHMPTYLASLLQ